jgi:[ribosomal protein S5]-alanine N-acetyltransferase
MLQRPTLQTPRLILRPFHLEDAVTVQSLAGTREVARFTLSVPHPYEDGMAEAWIERHEAECIEKQLFNFAITLRDSGELCGAMSLGLAPRAQRAEIGYWLGVPFWGQGYCTEAARAVVNYGFDALELNRIYANHFATNPASGRVMQKIGMRHEGTLRQHFYKWGVFVDAEYYGLLRSDWEKQARL